MRRYISIVLAVTVFLTMIFSVSFVNIFSASSAEYVIDFEGAQGNFYGSGNEKRITYADSVDITTAEGHGNVMQFKKLMVYRNDNYVNNPNDATVKWNTIYYPTAFRLPDSTGSNTLYLEKDEQYNVSFMMKKNSAVSNQYFQQITAALVFADSYQLGDLSGNIRDWVNNGHTVTLAVADLQKDDDFVKYSAEITVPKSGYVAFMLYGTNFATKCDISIDDIKITSTVIEDKNIIDFEDGQKTYLTTEANRIGYVDQMDIATLSGRGNVMHFKKLKVYRKGYDHWNTVLSPTAFRLVNGNGSETLYFEKNEQYTVRFKMKKNSAVVTSDFTNITAALVFNGSYSYQDGNIREWVESGITATLVSVDLSADSDFVEYTANITVPESGFGAFLLYGSGNDQKAWFADCDIDVDDISVEPTLYNEEKVTFENEQGTFYTNDKRICYADSVYVKKAEGHGNVMHFSDLKVYRNDGYYDEWNTIYYPSAFRIPTLDGKDTLYLEKDKKYTVSFEMKKNSAVSDVHFQQITAALVFADSYGIGKDKGNIRDWVNNGQTATLAVVDLSADSYWVTYAANITVPRSGYVAFMLYGTNWKTACDIDIDNISVEEISGENATQITCHNYDNKGNDGVITADKTDSFSAIERPFSNNAKFDGWYLDAALSIPAKGSVGQVSELWVKWRTELDRTVNTYDEENVEFVKVMGSVEAGSDALVDRVINGNITDKNFAQYGTFVEETKGSSVSETGNAVNFTSARQLDWNWPALVKIYDSRDENLGIFVPRANTAYKIGFKFKSTKQPDYGAFTIQLRALSPTGSSMYDKNNVYISNLTTVKYTSSDWITVESEFYTGDTVAPLFLTVISSNSFVYTEANIWIDDVVIEEIYNTPAIYFDTAGGSFMSPQICIAGKTIPEVMPPSREGYIFDGWFTDKEYTEPFTYNVMPEKNIKLYAKWIKDIDTPYGFTNGFETCDYLNNGINPNVPDNIGSAELTWINDSVKAYAGSGYISLATDKGDEYSQSLAAAAFRDGDGKNFYVVKGGRYKLTVAARGNDNTGHIYFVTADQVPTFGINSKNTVTVASFAIAPEYSGVNIGEWGVYEQYFIPEQTERIYVMLYGGSLGSSIDIDEISIEPVDETVATKVEYYDGETLVKKAFGKKGSLLVDASISNKAGLVFDGWRKKDGTLHLASTFPEEDIVLYASWREAEDLSNATSGFSDGKLTLNFEDAENAKKFYGTANNSAEPAVGVIYVTDDSKNARSGDSYLKLNKVGIWTEAWFRRVKFFDPDSVGNQVYLEPLSVYRVSFWANIEAAGTSIIRVATFDQKNSVTTYKTHYQHMLQDAEMLDSLGKWVKYEADVVVGSEYESLGIVISGGYLSGAIDDVSIQKLWDVKVNFDTNGGSPIDTITALAYDCVVEPEYPTKEGYDFMGWYSDKALTKVFKFAKTPVTNDITLYAKWEKAFVPETLYKEQISYTEVETEVANTPSDAAFDDKISIVDKDKIGAVSGDEPTEFPWIIVIAAGIAVVVLAFIGAIIIIIIRRKKKN